MGQTEVGDAIETFFTLQWPSTQEAPAEIRSFASELARDTVARIPAIDAAIAETTERWRPERMAVLDRLILRMAMCELIRGGTPAPVVINEALELARTFSTEDSVKFINGMLDGMLKKLPR
jgi:N utilization substance protein B